MPDQATIDAAKALLDICTKKKLTLATAESCTGGLVAATISEIAGSSLVLDRGFVTYSNSAKQQMLGVTPVTIDVYGAVSTECAQEMAKGALAHASVDLVISITGIAGPDGGTEDKPVGLVYTGIFVKGKVRVFKNKFSGTRGAVRCKAAKKAMVELYRLIK